MKTEIMGLKELSNYEIRLISGGGPTWVWFGAVLGHIADTIDFVNELPQNAIIAGVTIQAAVEERIDAFRYH